MDKEKLLEEIREFRGAFYESLLRKAFTQLEDARLDLSKYSDLNDTLVDLALNDSTVEYQIYPDRIIPREHIRKLREESASEFTLFLLNLHKIGILDSVKETELECSRYGDYSHLNKMVKSFNGNPMSFG